MKQQIGIVLIEDNPGDARLIEEMLREARFIEASISCAQTLGRGMELLDTTPADVILLDLGLPDSNGLASLEKIYERHKKTPLIIMTGLDDEEVGILAMTKGAQDYVIKGNVESHSLERIIRYAIERKKTETELQQALAISECRHNEIQALYNGAQVVLRSDTFETAARQIFTLARDLIKASSGYVALLSPGGQENEVVFLDSGGMTCTVDKDLPMPIRGLREKAYSECKIVYDNRFSESRWMQYLPDGHAALQNVLFAPLIENAKTVGLIGLANKPGGFTTDDVRKMSTFSDLAAISLRNTRDADALHSSLTFLETLINTIPNPVFYKDTRGNYQGCNDAFANTILGLPKNEIMDKTLADLSRQIPFQDATRYHQKDTDLLNTGDVQTYEAKVTCADRTVRDFCFNKAVYRDGSGNIAGIVGIMQDISERKQNEKRLEVSNRILNFLNQIADMESAIAEIIVLIKEAFAIDAVGIRLKEGDDFPYYATNGFDESYVRAEKYLFARDEAGKVITDENANPVLECMCGNVLCKNNDAALPFFTEHGSFWTNSTTDLMNSDHAVDLKKWRHNHCHSQGYESIALIPLIVDNDIIGLLQLSHKEKGFFSSDLIRFFEGLGASIGIAVQRITAEEKLSQSEARYRQLYDHMSSGVILYEPVENGTDFTLKEINPAGEKISQITHDDVIGKSAVSIFPGIKDMGLLHILQTVYRTNVPARHPVSFYKDDRLSQWVENYVFKLPSGDIVAVYDDKTREIEEQTEKEALLNHLQQAQKMESIGTLAGGIAHDFNNILSAIIGFSELAMERPKEDKDLIDDLSEIMNAGKRAKELVRQILAFSRQTDHELKPLRLDHIIKEVAQLIRSTLPTTIRIEKSIETSGEIMGDPTQIHQVLMNLCTNAYHAMHAEGGVLSIDLNAVSLEPDDLPPISEILPGNYIKITISDTGTGIAPEILPRIFDPYFTTKQKDKGTGLGLAVTHGVIKDHNGHILVESEVGRGTSFKIYLPSIKRKQDAPVQEEATELLRGNARILLVDDETAILKVNKIRLERLGYHVSTISSSQEARGLFAKQPDAFDLIITDMTMPELTGVQLAEKCLDIRPDIPVILCTGYSDIITEARAREIGITEYVMKPMLVKDLAEAIHRAVGKGNVEGIKAKAYQTQTH